LKLVILPKAAPSAGEGDAKNSPPFLAGKAWFLLTTGELCQLSHALIGGDDPTVAEANHPLNLVA